MEGEVDDSADASAVDADDAMTSMGSEDPGRGRRQWRPGDLYPDLPNEPPYMAYTAEYDEVTEAAELCDLEELARLRTYLDQQLSHLQGVVAKLANRLQRRLLAKQNRSWEFDLEEGLLDAGKLAPRRRQPVESAVLQDRARHRFSRYGGHPVDRQLRLDAWAADYGGGDVRGHPGPDTGALRGQGRNPRLYDAGLERWAEPRKMATRRQAG